MVDKVILSQCTWSPTKRCDDSPFRERAQGLYTIHGTEMLTPNPDSGIQLSVAESHHLLSTDQRFARCSFLSFVHFSFCCRGRSDVLSRSVCNKVAWVVRLMEVGRTGGQI